MATPQEMMFMNIAVQKGYVGKGTAEYILSYQKDFENKGQKIFIVNYLLAKKILTPAQVEEIKSICIRQWQQNQLSSNQATPINAPQKTDNISSTNSSIEKGSPANFKTKPKMSKEIYGSISATQKLNKKDIYNSISTTQKLNKKDIYNSLNQTKKYQMSDISQPVNTIMPTDVLASNSATPQSNLTTNTTTTIAPTATEIDISVQSSRSQIKAGDLFSKYRIEKEIGQGGMGFVYKVYDTKLERSVALKIVSTDNQVSEKRRKRFLQEIKATAQLDHQNIVKVLESGESPQSYFTMEHLEGGTLSEVIAKGCIKPIQAASIMCKIADALHYAHKNGIIHRDIKPSNIMFDKNKEPKLMDFGLSKMVDIDDNLSKSGEALGTPQYMSPEQANGNETEAKSDIYSLGTTLYEMITGKQVFDGDSYYDILNKIFHEDPIPPRSIIPDIPKDLEAICLKCLQKNPKNRYQNARALAKDLKNFIEHKSVSARPTHSFTKLSRSLKKNKNKILMTIFLCVVSFAFVLHHFYMSYSFRKELLKSLIDIQQKTPTLQSNQIFCLKTYHCFEELCYYGKFVNKNSLKELLLENPRMLHLHFMSLAAYSLENQEIYNWVYVYEDFVNNLEKYPLERYYYNINLGFLYLMLGEYQEAKDHFLKGYSYNRPDIVNHLTANIHLFYYIYASFFVEKKDLFDSENEEEIFEQVRLAIKDKQPSIIDKACNLQVTHDMKVFEKLENDMIEKFIKYCKGSGRK